MKILQIFLACLIFLIGQVVLSYAVDLKGEVIPSPADADEGSYWGHSVDISGTTLIAGSGLNLDNKSNVYIMERRGGAWEVLNHFPSPNPDHMDFFGHAVALEGNFAAIGAYEAGGKEFLVERGLLVNGPGKVYVYHRRNEGGFALMRALKAADLQNGDRFGHSVDINGTTLIVSAPFHNQERGAVYVFVLEGTKWKQQAKLQADDAGVKNRFGWGCAISEDTIVVGAPLAAAPARLSGTAYIFKRKGDAWAQVAKLAAHDGDGGDRFGVSVDVSKSRAIVGASKDENRLKRGSGSAYIFSEVDGTYTQEAKLTADELQEGASFGFTVAIDVNRVLVGAPTTDTDRGEDSGAVYAFLKVGPDWELQTTIIPERGLGKEGGEFMGDALALDGEFGRNFNYAAIGAPWDDVPKHPDAGSVYLFDTEDVNNLNIPLSKNIEDFKIPLSVEPIDELALIMLGDIKRTALLQNFPNPFNPETWIPYTLADDAAVQVRIYDVHGALVRQLDIGQQRAGRYLSRQTAAYWDGKDQFGASVASGVYFYTLEADAFSKTRRMVIQK